MTRALDDVGASLRGGYVLFGVEIRSKDGKEPSVSLNLQPPSTLHDAVQQVMRQMPGYVFEIASPHIINIFPKGAKEDPHDVLNTFVPELDIIQAEPDSVLTHPEKFIPQLAARLSPKATGHPRPGGSAGPGLSSAVPTVTLHLRRVTVRQILNAVSEATEQSPAEYPPVGWLCLFQPRKDAPGGGAYTWKFLFSTPNGWKQAQSPN